MATLPWYATTLLRYSGWIMSGAGLPLLHGMLVAFGLILPIGPQNLFIFQQGALHRSWWRATPAIAAAAAVDTAMILAAVSGVSLVLLSSVLVQRLLIVTGVLFLLRIGWLQWNARVMPAMESAPAAATATQVSTAIVVSALNPHAILDSVAVIGPSSLAYAGAHRWMFTLGCVVNSWLWFAALAWVGRHAGRLLITERSQRTAARASAIILWLCAAYLLAFLH